MGFVLAGLVQAWEEGPGGWATETERAQMSLGVGLIGGFLSLGLDFFGLTSGARLGIPVLVLVGLAELPVSGRVSIKVESWVLALFVVCMIGLCGWVKKKPLGGWGVLAIALSGGFFQLQNPFKYSEEAPLVLLTLDTLRADFIPGFSGEQTAIMPALSKRLERCRVYKNAFAPIALTGPSHTTMLSGTHVLEHGVRANGVALPSTLFWVPEQLQAAGWITRGVVSAAVLDAELGFYRGFDVFDSAFEDRPARLWSFARFLGYRPHSGSSTHRSGAESLALIPDFPKGSFTWLHLYDAHWPYTPSLKAAQAVGLTDNMPLPESGVGRMLKPGGSWDIEQVERGKKLYQAELEDLDRLLEQLFKTLPAETSLVIAGDHGESLDEHEYVFSHGKLPFSPDTHTLLAACGPTIQPQTVEEPVGLEQVASLLLELAGLQKPIEEDKPVLSVSFAAGFLSNRDPSHPLEEFAGIAIRENTTTLAWTRWTDPGRYERSQDPYELLPMPLTVLELEKLKAISAMPAAGEPEETLKSALEALGYLSPD